jgi:long-chain acyl-CoA synthetase
MLERAWHKMYPANVPFEIDFEKITIPEMLARTSEKFPDNTAISYEGAAINYRELNNLVNRFARALLDLGIGKGEKIAVLMPNAPQIVVTCQAVLRIGAVTVMNNPLYTETELKRQLNDSGASVLIITDDALEKALNLREKTAVRTIITSSMADLGPTDDKGTQLQDLSIPDSYRFLDLIDQYPPEPVANAAQWDDVANIIYTGGTTGVSKGVMLTHANLSCNVQQYSVWMHNTVDGEESWPMVYPIFHSAGYTMQNKSIYTGWKSILVPRPTPEILVDIIAGQKPSLLPGVATLFVGLLNFEKFREMDLSFIKAFMTGGGPLTVETLKQIKALRDVPMINIYGLSESSPVATATPWYGEEKNGSVGVPYPSTDMKIVDSTDATREMPTGEPGEILLKGPQVMKGYLNQPEETQKVLVDGWLYTGDVGFVDEFGYLTIVDRKKDVIVASGFNVYPKEIDELLFTHPKILEASTIGVPHEYRGETVKSYIVLKTGETTTAEDLIAYCKEHLAPYKVPRIFEFIDTLPKSAVGKILRKDLRALDRKQG